MTKQRSLRTLALFLLPLLVGTSACDLSSLVPAPPAGGEDLHLQADPTVPCDPPTGARK